MRGTETDPIRTVRGAGYALEEASSRKVLASVDKAGED